MKRVPDSACQHARARPSASSIKAEADRYKHTEAGISVRESTLCHRCQRTTRTMLLPLRTGHIGRVCEICRTCRRGRPYAKRSEYVQNPHAHYGYGREVDANDNTNRSE